MSAPATKTCFFNAVGFLAIMKRSCIVFVLFSMQTVAFEFYNSTDVLSRARSACLITSSFKNGDLIKLLRELDDVSFVGEDRAHFGVINVKSFVWSSEKTLVAKNNPSAVLSDNDIILFQKLKMDRTCLLATPVTEVPDVYVYRGKMSAENIIEFVNNYCNTYRTTSGHLSREGEERTKLLSSLFTMESSGSPKMSDMIGKKSHFCKAKSTCSEENSLSGHHSHVQYMAKEKKPVKIKECDKISPPTTKEFVEKYLKTSKPVIIQGATSDWPANEKWTNSFLRQKYGEKVIHIKLTPKGEFEGVEPASLWDDYGNFEIPESVKSRLLYPDLVVVRPATMNIRFSEFMDLIESISNGSVRNISAYLEYTSLKENMEELEKDVPEMTFFKNILTLKHLNIWLSDGNTLGKLHFDPFDNFLVMLSGKKQVILFEPHDNSRLYEAHIPEAILSFNKQKRRFRRKTLLDSTSMVMSPVDILKPDFTRFPKFADAYPLNCTIEEGEVLYMPAFWWHEVQSYPGTERRRNLAVNFWYDPFLTREFPCPECKLDLNPNYRHLL